MLLLGCLLFCLGFFMFVDMIINGVDNYFGAIGAVICCPIPIAFGLWLILGEFLVKL